jgi:CBS domain containing-hemolysin-like protein
VLKYSPEVKGVKASMPVTEAFKHMQDNNFSRLIVFGPNQNDIVGYVMRKDILQAYLDHKDIEVSELSKKILILTENTSGQILLNRLLAMKAHIAAVIDLDGTFLGIVTLEDLLERKMGFDIYDEYDHLDT